MSLWVTNNVEWVNVEKVSYHYLFAGKNRQLDALLYTYCIKIIIHIKSTGIQVLWTPLQSVKWASVTILRLNKARTEVSIIRLVTPNTKIGLLRLAVGTELLTSSSSKQFSGRIQCGLVTTQESLTTCTYMSLYVNKLQRVCRSFSWFRKAEIRATSVLLLNFIYFVPILWF